MHVFKAIAIITLGLIYFVGCKYAPWRVEEYINPETVSFNIRQGLPQYEEFEHYFINGAFVHVFLKAHNETAYSGRSPYALIINAYAKGMAYERLMIHNIFIESETYKGKFLGLQLPAMAEFNTYYRDIRCAYAKSENSLLLDFKLDEDIKVVLDIEIQADINKRKVIKYHFFRNLRKGRFIWLSA